MRKFLLIGLLFGASRVYAQETTDTFALNEIVVSAPRTPVERSAIAASISVLRGDDLRRRGVQTVADALREVPGIALSQNGSYGSFGSVFLRGGESDYVQVLVDGVQINSPGEHFDFGNLTLENIDRIEVVRGPVSVLYGSDAVSGVVQLFTRSGNARTRYELAASGGRGSRLAGGGGFGTQTLSGLMSGATAGLSYSLGVNHLRSDGAYPLNNEDRNNGATARLQYFAPNGASLAASVRYGRNRFNYPTDGSGNIVDANQRDDAQSVSAGLELAHRFLPRFEARAMLGFSRNDDEYTDDKDTPSDTLGFYGYFSDERFQRESADLRIHYYASEHATVVVGGEVDRERERGTTLSLSQYGPSAGTSGEARANRAAFVQVLSDFDRFHFQAGTRVDDNDEFGSFSTYRGGVALTATPSLTLRMSAGTGFKQPRFYEQFATGWVIGNPNLQPETSRSIDGGVELHGRGARFTATYFSQIFRNLIQYVGMPARTGDPNYLNLGGARASGLELEAERNFGRLNAHASFTAMATTVTDAGTGDDPLFVAGEKLIRRPGTTASAMLSYALRGWYASAALKYVGARDDLDFTNYPPARIELSSYTRTDITGEAPIGSYGLKLTARIENLFDTDYQEAFNFPARGRMVFVGVRLAR